MLRVVESLLIERLFQKFKMSKIWRVVVVAIVLIKPSETKDNLEKNLMTKNLEQQRERTMTDNIDAAGFLNIF